MQMRYCEARDTILDTTEIGYTVASQDRLWTVFIFDLWSGNAWRYHRLYPTGPAHSPGPWVYDVGIGGGENVPFWTRRDEAERYAENLRRYLERQSTPAERQPEVYVINWGDDARYEAALIGRDSGARCRTEPKFAGSRAAWAAMVEMSARLAEDNR